ncbi:hypothetical protein KC327_g68 [Hortaea werneckii]|nr:hypothetical protein KC327_g68 [Hortaea werneckii]
MNRRLATVANTRPFFLSTRKTSNDVKLEPPRALQAPAHLTKWTSRMRGERYPVTAVTCDSVLRTMHASRHATVHAFIIVIIASITFHIVIIVPKLSHSHNLIIVPNWSFSHT